MDEIQEMLKGNTLTLVFAFLSEGPRHSYAIGQAAYRCAVRHGVHMDYREDCALGFVEAMLRKDFEGIMHSSDGVFPTAWVYRCATNFMIEFVRSYKRLCIKETPCPFQERRNCGETWRTIPVS